MMLTSKNVHWGIIINIYIYTHIHIYIEREGESNQDEKFDSCLYQFIAFIFLLKPLHKIFFTVVTVGLKQKVIILWGKNLSCKQ